MVVVTNFTPVNTKKAGIKDDITFRVTQLAPLDPAFLQANPQRFVSLLDNKGSFKRLSVTELQQKTQSGALLYSEVTSSATATQATIIIGNVGIVPATSSQVQDQLSKGQTSLTAKRAELSSLVLLNRASNPKPPPPVQVASSISFATKGQVLDIASTQSAELTYLFLGSPKFANVVKIIAPDKIQVDAVSKFNNEPVITIVNTDVPGTKLPGSIRSVYYYTINSIITPSSKAVSIAYVAQDPSAVSGDPQIAVTSAGGITINFNKTNPPTALQLKQALDTRADIADLLDVALVGDGSGKIIEPLVDGYFTDAGVDSATESIFNAGIAQGTIVDGYTLNKHVVEGYGTTPVIVLQSDVKPSYQTNLPGSNNNLLFTLKPSTIKVNASAFSALPTSDEIAAINASPVTFAAVPGIPILNTTKVGSNTPTLQEYSALVQQEIPLTTIFASTAPSTNSQFVGNLDLSSLTVTIHDDDQTIILVQNGAAQPGISVQYKLHTQPDQSQQIEVGDVDVTVKLSGSPATLPIRGQIGPGLQAVQLAVRIATTPSQLAAAFTQGGSTSVQSGSLLNVGTFGAAAAVDQFQSKVGKTVSNFSQQPANPAEFYFNYQVVNPQGQVVNINKYGTIRIFDSISLMYKDPSGKNITFHQTQVIAVDAANSIITMKDAIGTAIPINTQTYIVIPQTPLNPGRTYRATISCQDKEGAPS